MPPASTFALYGVHFRDANNGCIVGGTSTTGYVMHSTDGGATWTNPPVQIAALPLYAVRCIDSTTIVAVGNSGTIYQTIDGGASWNVRTTPPGAFRPLKSLSVVGNTVYAAGDTVVIVSTDQGSSWTRKNTGLTSPRLLNGLAMLGSGEGWAVGDAGVVYRTWDGCDSWQFQLCGTTQNGFNVDLASVHFVNTTSGWAVGANTNPGGSLFLSTLDGGSTWTRQTPPAGLAVALNSVYFHDEKVGWAVGASGRCARTTDGGITWTNAAMPPASTFSLYSVDFRDTSNGLIVGGTTTAGYVMKSTDGGATWSNPPLQIAALPLYAVKYVDSVTVVTVGNMGTIYQSTDGGGTWAGRTAPPGALRPLKGISVVGNTVFAAGDTVVIVSTDGGTSWTRKNTGLITSRLLNGIAMANEITGWAVGDAGVIYNTTDGGNTWTYQQTPYPTRHHKAIAYTPGLAYCVGVAGITVRNSTPVIVGVEDDRASRPVRFVLDQNYPNPFNPTTTISFELSTRSEVTLVVYDLMGRVVATLLKEEKPAGRHTAMWDARGTASGVYFYRLVAKHSSENTGQKSVVTKKLILLK
jgi:photosystem II stability/assembly factor-like uncharacterized protein